MADMADDVFSPQRRGMSRTQLEFLDSHEQYAFGEFKNQCLVEGLLPSSPAENGDELSEGICDDGTLLRFLRARRFIVPDAMKQYKSTRTWRDNNRLLDLYENIEAGDYEETRKLYTHWTGRRDKQGLPSCWFEIKQLTSTAMTAYEKSCAIAKPLPAPEGGAKAESTAMLRLFCTYDSLVRFVLPFCSAVPGRPNFEIPITSTNCIVDISGVGLLQFWKLRSHMQAASTLATAHYPETLGRTYVIGAPSFFPTIWAWVKSWFDPNTVSKIIIVPAGKELATLSESYDIANIPRKYGGEFDFEFGMPPSLDAELAAMSTWLGEEKARGLPIGPMRWIIDEKGSRTALAVGKVDGKERKVEVLSLSV